MLDSWMLHREASDHPEEVSTHSQGTQEDQDSAVETVKTPAHCRCRTTNQRGKLLKFRLKTHTAHTKDSDN